MNSDHNTTNASTNILIDPIAQKKRCSICRFAVSNMRYYDTVRCRRFPYPEYVTVSEYHWCHEYEQGEEVYVWRKPAKVAEAGLENWFEER